MSKPKGPPKGEPWIWLTREVLTSPAWRGLGINARRAMDFLLREHMAHAGRNNGLLVAPREQLIEWGVGARHISGAIAELKKSGLVDVEHSVGRRPNRYTLNWLQLHDGGEPAQRWRTASEGKSFLRGGQYPKGSHNGAANSARREVIGAPLTPTASEGIPLQYPKGTHYGRSSIRREVIRPDSKGIRREAPIKKFLPSRGVSTDLDKEEGSAGPASEGRGLS